MHGMHNGPGVTPAQVVETVRPTHSVFSCSYFAGVQFPAPPCRETETGNAGEVVVYWMWLLRLPAS